MKLRRMVLALLGTFVAGDAARAGEPLSVTSSDKWARIELHEDRSPLFVKEPYTETSRRLVPDIAEAFGTKEPPSSRFLLHAAAGWDREDPRPPVLLVHGAVVDATRNWGPGGFQGRAGEGLAARLAATGRRVFAITFAHPHGCNWLESEHLASAIARVRALTGAARVDVVAHSKGGIAARLYASNVRKPGMTAFRGDIRKLVLIGVPNGGIDIAFAWPNINYWVIHNKASGPLSWTEALVYGVWRDLRKDSLYAAAEGGGAFPGQAQMLRRWDGVYGLPETDDQYDVKTTYEGGRGAVSRSLGIDRAIKDAGDVMAQLDKAGVDKRVEVSLLAGSKPMLLGMVGERRGPSDGMLFVRSALASEGIARAGAKVARKDVLHLSHIELAYAEPAVRWIEEALR